MMRDKVCITKRHNHRWLPVLCICLMKLRLRCVMHSWSLSKGAYLSVTILFCFFMAFLLLLQVLTLCRFHFKRFTLTRSCLETSLIFVIWTCKTFEKTLISSMVWGKYLKGSCLLLSDLHSSFKYFLKVCFVREISPKESGSFGRYTCINVLTFSCPTPKSRTLK